jgi:hypothetical protein
MKVKMPTTFALGIGKVKRREASGRIGYRRWVGSYSGLRPASASARSCAASCQARCRWRRRGRSALNVWQARACTHARRCFRIDEVPQISAVTATTTSAPSIGLTRPQRQLPSRPGKLNIDFVAIRLIAIDFARGSYPLSVRSNPISANRCVPHALESDRPVLK